MGLRFRQLEVVRAVASYGTVGAVSAELGISQPAVSMLLRVRSASAVFFLLMRWRAQLQPTTALRVILDETERVISGVQHIERLVEDMRDVSSGTVVVAAPPTVADKRARASGLPGIVNSRSLAGTKWTEPVGEMTSEAASYPGIRFPVEIISYAREDGRLGSGL